MNHITVYCQPPDVLEQTNSLCELSSTTKWTKWEGGYFANSTELGDWCQIFGCVFQNGKKESHKVVLQKKEDHLPLL